MKSKEIAKMDAPELNAVEKSKADQIKKTFEPMAEMLACFEDDYNELMSIPVENITSELIGKYRRLRIDIGKIRIETGKLKDKQKEYIKLEDKAIMGVHNILVWAVKEKEDKLKERENYFEIQEQKRLKKLQEDRAEKLSLYVEDAHDRDLSKFADDEFEALFAIKKKEQEDRITAEKKASEERIAKEKADAEERKRIVIENEKLKKEVAERERLAKIEAKKREKAEHERKKLEDELKAKREAEHKAKEEEAERVQIELNKGDAAKVKDLISDLESLKTKYVFKSAKNTNMYKGVNALIDKIVVFILK